MNCRACNKQLTNPAQIAKGIGPNCERRELRNLERHDQTENHFAESTGSSL